MSDKQGNFIALAADGEVLPEEIDDFVDIWHDGDGDQELHDFLGMTEDEYSLWVSNPELIDLIVASRHNRVSIVSAVNDNIAASDRIAARSDEAWKLGRLRRWIEQQLGSSARN